MIEILIILSIAWLWRLGGWDKAGWAGYRDVLVPIGLGIWYIVTMNIWSGLLTCGGANSIRLGYGAWDPEHDSKPSLLARLTHDREGAIIRMIYGFFTSFMIGIFPTIYGVAVEHSDGIIARFTAYVLFNSALEYGLNKGKANVWWTECLTGAGRALVIFACR